MVSLRLIHLYHSTPDNYGAFFDCIDSYALHEPHMIGPILHSGNCDCNFCKDAFDLKGTTAIEPKLEPQTFKEGHM